MHSPHSVSALPWPSPLPVLPHLPNHPPTEHRSSINQWHLPRVLLSGSMPCETRAMGIPCPSSVSLPAGKGGNSFLVLESVPPLQAQEQVWPVLLVLPTLALAL